MKNLFEEVNYHLRRLILKFLTIRELGELLCLSKCVNASILSIMSTHLKSFHSSDITNQLSLQSFFISFSPPLTSLSLFCLGLPLRTVLQAIPQRELKHLELKSCLTEWLRQSKFLDSIKEKCGEQLQSLKISFISPVQVHFLRVHDSPTFDEAIDFINNDETFISQLSHFWKNFQSLQELQIKEIIGSPSKSRDYSIFVESVLEASHLKIQFLSLNNVLMTDKLQLTQSVLRWQQLRTLKIKVNRESFNMLRVSQPSLAYLKAIFPSSLLVISIKEQCKSALGNFSSSHHQDDGFNIKDIQKQVLDYFRSLQQLELQNKSNKMIFENRSEKQLQITNQSKNDDTICYQQLTQNNCQQLVSLSLNTADISQTSLCDIFKQQKNLQKIHISKLIHFSQNTLRILVDNHCSTLNTLYLESVRATTDSIAYLISNSKSLTKLGLNKMDKLDSLFSFQFLTPNQYQKQHIKLESLDLSFNSSLITEDLVHLGYIFSNLKKLKVAGCSISNLKCFSSVKQSLQKLEIQQNPILIRDENEFSTFWEIINQFNKLQFVQIEIPNIDRLSRYSTRNTNKHILIYEHTNQCTYSL